MMVALAMSAVLSLSSASNARLPPNAHIALDAEREYVPMVGDRLASLLGELDGESTSGTSIERVMATLEERLNRTSCKRADPDDTQSQPREITCNVPDAGRLFPYYADLRQAKTPTEHDSRGRSWSPMRRCSGMHPMSPSLDLARMRRQMGCYMCSFRSKPGTRS